MHTINRKRQVLTGRRFGKLTVISSQPKPKGLCGRNANQYWLCHCDCGNSVVVRGDAILRGQESCGCVNATHRQSRTPIYRVWQGMKARCTNPNSTAYSCYGGRGITICTRWLRSFEAFFADMGGGYRPGLELERMDNDGPYAPENCRWATRHEQMSNTRGNHYLTHNGISLTVTQWASVLGVRVGLLRNRLHMGWPVDRTLTEPAHTYLCNHRFRKTTNVWYQREKRMATV
jgi:hypothetical protein